MKKIIIALSFLGVLGGAVTSAFAGYFSDTPAFRCETQITRTLQIGSENRDVSILQSMLVQAGYLYVAPNGYFGPSTKAAVRRFQNDNGIPANGTVGESTRNAINERLCDTDVRGGNSSDTYYGYSSGTTYVDQYDPYVKVILPKVQTPAIYATPQEYVSSSFSNNFNTSEYVTVPQVVTTNSYNSSYIGNLTPVTNQIQGTTIVNAPGVGYTYAIAQKTGSITIVSPGVRSSYNEGDMVNLVWTTTGLNASGFHISLENGNSGQKVQIATTGSKSHSFTLTKEILDAVCTGQCNDAQKGSFKIVISTPVTDIAGYTSNFSAAVSPITIYRPYSVSAAVTLTANTSPVNSGTPFKLYVNSASINLANPSPLADIVVKLHATCVNAIQVSIAGIPCGQELSMPASVLVSQQGVPVMVTNTSWYKQDVVFDVVITTLSGQKIGTAKTTVIANPAPFSW